MKYKAVNDQTLLEALQLLSPDSSKTTLRSWLKDGRVTVDGKINKIGSSTIEKGQTVALGARSHYIKSDIQILFEDKYLVVIDKPEGLLSVATNFEKGDTAHAILKDHFRPRRVYPVHRLDQDTSGVMMFALNEEARDKLKECFESHSIERAYTAVVEGVVDPSTGTWESYLFEDGNYVVHSTSDSRNGKLAITHYEILSVHKKYSTLVLKIETGRKNQIRVHCQDAGHPIVGDKKYGAKTNPFKRLGLHAHLLAFHHPITKQPMRFESPLPPSFHLA